MEEMYLNAFFKRDIETGDQLYNKYMLPHEEKTQNSIPLKSVVSVFPIA